MSEKISQTVIRTARKDRQCSEHGYHTIKKGDRYLYAAGPPWAVWNSTGRWYVIAACLRCAKVYGLHTNETLKQVSEGGE